MNKLLVNIEIDFSEPIIFVANNHKDIEDYLTTQYNFDDVSVEDDCVSIVERPGYSRIFGTLKWIKHI